MAALQAKLQAYMHEKRWLDAPGEGINGKRSEILRDCITSGSMPRGLYTLTVPTGGGKMFPHWLSR